ncbi:MAG: uracil-DNA glycosylase [Kofleriaceae bacterium]
MRTCLALLLVAACADVAPVESPDDGEEGTEGKEDAAGATLCDALPVASQALCLQIPNNGWRTALRSELTAPYFEPLARAVADAREADTAASTDDNVYPAHADTFAALRRVSPGRVKVVIVGQDPYIGVGQAMGLSFSVAPGLAVPPSLENIYAELMREAADPAASAELPHGFVCPANGDLTSWARRGVFMLNAILTVRHGEAGSHASFGWQSLTDAILRVVRERNADQATAYMLWGSFARAARPPAAANILTLESNHPSPLTSGFVGNGHFAAANAFLVEHGRSAIDWSLAAPADGVETAHDCTER